jgi:hypothetical protein
LQPHLSIKGTVCNIKVIRDEMNDHIFAGTLTLDGVRLYNKSYKNTTPVSNSAHHEHIRGMEVQHCKLPEEEEGISFICSQCRSCQLISSLHTQTFPLS